MLTQRFSIRLLHTWYNPKTDKAEAIESLISEFERNGNANVNAASVETHLFTAEEWKGFSEQEKEAMLQHYRLAYLADAYVNWCPQLGTVLANDEVQDGLSVRGGYPVERKLMRQWRSEEHTSELQSLMRISYAVFCLKKKTSR